MPFVIADVFPLQLLLSLHTHDTSAWQKDDKKDNLAYGLDPSAPARNIFAIYFEQTLMYIYSWKSIQRVKKGALRAPKFIKSSSTTV